MRFLFLFLLSSTAFGQGTVSSTCIWSGSVADCLPASGLLLKNQRDLRLGEASANGSNYVALQAPASIASDFTLTLPSDDGDASEVLGTNGSGVLDWTFINNANVGGSAAIAYSKLNLTGSILNADVHPSAAIAGSKISPAFTAATSVNAASDVEQLVVTAHSTQTNSLLVIQSNAGGDYWEFAGDTLGTGKLYGTDGQSNMDGKLTILNESGVVSSGSNMSKWVFGNDTDVTGAYFMQFQDGSGEIGSIKASSATAVAFNTTSDARLKKDFKPYKNGLDTLMKVKVRDYAWIEDGHREIGFIAQELQDYWPQAVNGDPNGDVKKNPMGVDYGKLTPLLVAALQDLSAKNDELEKRIKILEEK